MITWDNVKYDDILKDADIRSSFWQILEYGRDLDKEAQEKAFVYMITEVGNAIRKQMEVCSCCDSGCCNEGCEIHGNI